MTRSLRSPALYGAILASGLLLGACGKKDEPAPTPTPAPASTAPVAATPAPATSVAVMPPATASTSASAVAATPAPAAPPVEPFSISKLTLGSAVNAEHQVTKPGEKFATRDKTIYASVATEGSTGGATLNAKWSYLEGTGQLVSSVSQSIATDGPAVTTFKVYNPDLWPEGKYRVEISLDGKPVTKQDFQIAKR
ncbi:MAG TPA: hypothetical protein VIL60_02320 [Rhodanobacter sp.]